MSTMKVVAILGIAYVVLSFIVAGVYDSPM
jgi:hypothetical protein